tara:strand:- start:356 stop:1528 length:1173 start_codon:yes stop_codon:yes gene_type:complete
MRYLWLTLTTWALINIVGCTSFAAKQEVVVQQIELPNLNTTMFTPLQVPSMQEVFQLNQQQKNDFISYYSAANNQDIPGNVRLFQYLEDYLNDFGFRGVTLKASEALELKTGNCLTLAIVTKALADLVGLEIAFQRVNSAPVFARHSHLLTLSSHVRTYVYDPNYVPTPDMILIRRPSIIIDYFPDDSDVSGNMVAQADFMSMYYQNLAADALVNKQLDYAFALLKQGLSLNPLNAETLNTLAVTFNRVGETSQAERLYKFVLDNGFATGNVIANYVALLQLQGRDDEVLEFAKQIEGIDDDNPYRWIDMGEDAFATGYYARASRFYKKAHEIAPYLHESQFGLAKSYYQLGRANQAEEALSSAIEMSYDTADKRLYKAKLKVLLAEHKN